MQDYLPEYQDKIDVTKIQQQREHAKKTRYDNPSHRHRREVLTHFPDFKTTHFQGEEATVSIGKASELSESQMEQLKEDMKTLIPWRKGPFELFGNPIDSEWRSDLKWERLLPFVSPLEGRVVADIGCNNGYYMFRMLPQKPRLVIGFDPTTSYAIQFQFLQQFVKAPELYFEMLGIEHMSFYPNFFDTVFCLGILYHHPDPIGMLRDIKTSMKVGGELLVESQGIPGEETVALFPAERYAKVPNTWFVPTASCLVNWIRRAGFDEVDCFKVLPLSTEEQRSTSYSSSQSLADFLDPEDSSKTIEGYPAPVRIYVKAIKKR